jgi:hypothetical protein
VWGDSRNDGQNLKKAGHQSKNIRKRGHNHRRLAFLFHGSTGFGPSGNHRPTKKTKRKLPLLVHGFRPFFLLAGIYGAGFLIAWLAIFFEGASYPNAGKLFFDFLLSKEVVDVFLGGEAVHTFREGYTPPEHVKPYLLNLEGNKVFGLERLARSLKESQRHPRQMNNQFKQKNLRSDKRPKARRRIVRPWPPFLIRYISWEHLAFEKSTSLSVRYP